MITNTDRILITGGSGFIGTNLIELLTDKGFVILNFDKARPLKENQAKYWFEGNLLDKKTILAALEKFKPSIVIHLAARTDTLSNNIEDYIDNTKGTENLIQSVKACETIKHVVITSTQYVYKSKQFPFPFADDQYLPHTTYGESKVITEELTRKGDLLCAWTIVRPSNIWGPWHMRYPQELWKMIDKGFYVHASRKEVIRTYGYVKNVCYQIFKIIDAAPEMVHKKTYYLGDLPIDSFVWLNNISLQLRNKKLKRFPRLFFMIPALIGDLLNTMGIKFPLYSTRYKNMIEDFYAPTNVTIHEFGVASPNIEENIRETIVWIRGEGKAFLPYWNKKEK